MQVTGEGGIYKATWEDDSLEITFERFNEDKKSVSASLWIRDYQLPNSLVRFEFSQNIGSSRSISTLAKEIDSIYPKMEDYWRKRLTQACTKVLIEFMAGEPVKSIRDVRLTDTPTFQIDPYVFMNYPTLVYGDGGIGKSLFAAYLAVLVTEGWVTDDIGVEPCNVLYLDWESSEEDLTERVDMIASGLECIERPNIFYRFCSRGLADDIEYVRREVIEKEIRLVIVDSAGPASAKPTDADEVIKFFTALRSLRTSSLILGHKPQNGSNPFGSVYWKNYARSVWEMVSDSSEHMGHTDIGLMHTKVNRGPRHKRMGYRVTFSDTPTGKGAFYSILDAGDLEVVNEKLKLEDRLVAHLLKIGKQHYKKTAEDLQVNEKTVYNCFDRHKNRFERFGNGVFGVKEIRLDRLYGEDKNEDGSSLF